MLIHQSLATWLAACYIFCGLALNLWSQVPAEQGSLPFFIGTYTGGSSQGIYRSELDLETGALAAPRLVAELKNPSFLAIHPDSNTLYAVSEVAEGDQQVVSYRIAADGSLDETGNSATSGSGPCYVSTDATGKLLLVANYGSGSVSAFQIRPDGSLGPLSGHQQHSGSSVNQRRQQGPHAHCVLVDPSNQYACVADLGLDQVLVYELDHSTGKLLQPISKLDFAPGSGPRHLAFHPNGELAFVIHELTSELSSCSWQPDSGTLTELFKVSTLPEKFEGDNSTAEVLVHPNGKFVYGSNRGHNSLAIFQIASDGRLTSLGHTSTGGRTPRNFRIDPTGRFLLAENQQSDSIVVFRIDLETGQLTRTGHTLEVGSPVCIKFLLPKA